MKKVIKKLIICLGAIVLGLVPASSVFADSPTGANATDVANAQSIMESEAQAMLILSTYKKCIMYQMEIWVGDFTYNSALNGNMFDNSALFITGTNRTIGTGYWLENQVQSNGGDDGAIYCYQGDGQIQTLAANVLGVSEDYLLCGVDGAGGIIMNHTHACNGENDDNYHINYNTQSNESQDEPWAVWLKTLFDAKKAEQQWDDITFDNIFNVNYGGDNGTSSVVGYYAYNQELVYRCGSSQIDTSLPTGFMVSTPLNSVLEDGGVYDRYFSNNSHFEYGFVDRMTNTDCTDVVGFANEDNKYNAYRDRVLAIYNKDCKTYYETEAQSLGDQLSDEAAAKIDELNASTATNPWLMDKDTAVRSMQCVDIPDMERPIENIDDPIDAGDIETCTDATSNECREKACYQAAGSLGWIICPVIFTTRDAIDGIYDNIIEPLLMVDPAVIASIGTGTSPTYKIWATFRNLANILFAIVLLAVIFSQVTGFGIDNYGVKKILPKLIVTAILVNLSLIICGVLVDASDLLGGGIKRLFDSLAAETSVDWLTQFTGESDPALSSVNVIGTVLAYILGLLVAAGGVAVGVGVGTSTIAVSALVIPILLLILSGIIAAFFAFVILGTRQALIIIMIAISPLAFVLYALPNTQGIFKKWLKIFEGLLLVYPAASLLVGGGYLASRLILSNIEANPFMAIIAGLVSIVPYFMIPKLTSKSMDAIGGIGNAINGISRGSRSRATNGINNSEAVKRRRQAGIDAARTRNANRYLNSRRGQRDLETLQNGGNVSRARRARLATALQGSNADYETNKGILDAAQTRDDINTGNLAAVDNFKRQQGHLDIDDKAAHIGDLARAAEMERMDANNTRAFADNNDSAAIEAEAIALAGAGLGDAANLSRYNAAMNRLAKIDPSAYRRAMDGSIAATNAANAYGANIDPVRAAAEAQATRQAIKDNAIANSDIAKEQGLKGLTKANTANNLDTADAYTQQQAAGSVKDMLNLDDDYVARLAGDTVNGQGPIAANSNIQDTARMALEAMAANPKMAEDKKAKYLNDLVRIATNGTQSNYADYQANQAAIANQDLISVDLATGGQLTVDRREIPNGDAKQIDPTRSRRIASDEMQIVFKDGSQYNTKSKIFTPSHGGPTP